ncbi:hypothetical protein GEMRC1_005775 [Eukaryota sp. GEM-RC1]
MWNIYGGPVIDNYGTIMFTRDYFTLENENSLEPPPVLKNHHSVFFDSNEAFIYLYIDNSADAQIHLLRGDNYMMNGGTLRGYLYTYANASLIFPALGGEGQNSRVYLNENSWLVGQGEVLFDGSDIDARGIFNMTGDDARIIARGGTVWFRHSAKIASTAPFIIDGAFVDCSGANHEFTNVIVLNGTLYTDAALTVSLNLEVYNGLVSLDGAGGLTITEGQFIFKGGELGGVSHIVILDDVYSVWSCLTPTKGGNFIGYGSTLYLGSLIIEGACPKTWTRRSLFLHGETFWSGGSIETTGAGTLSVELSGSLHSLHVNSISIDGNFINKGKIFAYDSLNVTSRLVTTVGSRFEAFNGTSRFFAGGMLPGTIFLDHNTELIFMALAFHMDHTSRFIGNGTIIFDNAMSTFLGIVEDMEVIINGGTTQFRAPAKINNCRSQLLVLDGVVSFARSETHNKIEVCVFNIYGGTTIHNFALELTVIDMFSIFTGSYDLSGTIVSRVESVFLFNGGHFLGFGTVFVSGYAQWNCTVFRINDGTSGSMGLISILNGAVLDVVPSSSCLLSSVSLSLLSTFSIPIPHENSSTHVIVDSSVNLYGILEVEFDPFNYWSDHLYLLLDSASLVGKFTSLKATCTSIFEVSYTSTSVFGSLDNYVKHLNEVSYVSTSGIDDPCCGTFSSPCASFKGVLERMGRKGKIYFHEGIYSLNLGLGKVSDVDWEVIGLGDVIIEGMETTLIEIQFSNFSLSNLDVRCSSLICFSVSNSTVFLRNSTIFHNSGGSAISSDHSAAFRLTSSSLDLHEVTVSSMLFEDEFLSCENSTTVLNNFNLFDFYTAKSVIYSVNSNILLQNNFYRNINCKSLIEAVTSILELTEIVVSNMSCDVCFYIVGGNVVVYFMDVFDTSGSLFLIFKVDFMDVEHLNIYGSFSDTLIAAQNTTLNLTDVSVFTSELNNLLDFYDSSGVCRQLLVDTSIVSDSFALTDIDFTFTDLLFTNSSVGHVYLIQNSSIVVNDCNLVNLLNFESYLFDLSGGSFVLKNSVLTKFNGNLFLLESTTIALQNVSILNFCGGDVFLVSDSSLFMKSFLITSPIDQSKDKIVGFLKTFHFSKNSSVIVTHDSKFEIPAFLLILNSSEFLLDDSVVFSSSNFSLIATNSRFQTDMAFLNIHILSLSSSTFESSSTNDVNVISLHCLHCQLLGNSLFEVVSVSNINYGNFSSPVSFQESVTTSSVSGEVQLFSFI